MPQATADSGVKWAKGGSSHQVQWRVGEESQSRLNAIYDKWMREKGNGRIDEIIANCPTRSLEEQRIARGEGPTPGLEELREHHDKVRTAEAEDTMSQESSQNVYVDADSAFDHEEDSPYFDVKSQPAEEEVDAEQGLQREAGAEWSLFGTSSDGDSKYDGAIGSNDEILTTDLEDGRTESKEGGPKGMTEDEGEEEERVSDASSPPRLKTKRRTPREGRKERWLKIASPVEQRLQTRPSGRMPRHVPMKNTIKEWQRNKSTVKSRSLMLNSKK
jgi:hypothetical protein